MQYSVPGWQPDYLTMTESYPIVRQEEHIVPLLRNPFARAVILRDPKNCLSPSEEVNIVSDKELAARYWADESDPAMGRLMPGRIEHNEDVTTDGIRKESLEAKIYLSSAAVAWFTERCNHLRGLITQTYNDYTNNRPYRVISGYTLFTPKGGQGRAPEAHIDNTILTCHWGAALATLRLYDGFLCDETWDTMNMVKRKLKPADQQKRDIDYLIKLARQPDFMMSETQPGDVVFGKGQYGLDLDDSMSRASVCVHASSETIIQNGQAGFLMTPQMPK
jgi:hypothetical protein